MGLFDWLRSGSGRSSVDIERGPNTTRVSYSGRGYIGEAFDSPDGTWTAVTGRTFDPPEYRTFLFHGDEFQFTATGERPESCAVANTGVVIVADWLAPDKSDLSGEVYALNPEGDILIQGTLDANIDHPAISTDGRFGSISTYQPDTTTYIFDLDAGELRSEHTHRHGNVGAADFRQKDGEWVISLRFSEGTYDIDLDGNVVEKSPEIEMVESRERLMNSSDIDDLEEAIALLEEEYNQAQEHHREELPKELADTKWKLSQEIKKEDGVTDECWASLNDALLYYLEAHPPSAAMRGAAKNLRFQGNYYERNGRIEDALKCFQRIEELEAEHNLSLLTDADQRRLEELPSQLDE